MAPEAAFAGFQQSAVITVAAVLVISRALARSGAMDALAGGLIGASGSQSVLPRSACWARCSPPS